ncbi:MAG: tetratricopeptide repeat protein [Armatimonadota bacterium]|nr:tetratricopeptide repeat protein [bacterium]
MKKVLFLFAIVALISITGAWAGGLADCTGVIRVFGDQSNWMSTCFVVGDGSWVVTTIDAVSEKVGPQATRLIRYPLFISPYTGAAYQCELKAQDKDLNIALLKLPVTGLPSVTFAQGSDFSKAAYGTLGELMSGDPIGNRWPTEIYGITREKSGESYKLAVGEWNASQVFVTEIDKYHWMFLIDVNPDKSVPNGSIIARGPLMVGMYLNRLVITGGSSDQVFGRCSISTAIARWLGDHGMRSESLYSPPTATIRRDDNADAIFQLQARIYSMIGAARPDLALESAQALVKMRPSDAQPYLVLGIALAGVGRFDEAITQYDEAARIDPMLPTLHASRAMALIGQKKPDEAEKEFLKAIEEAPGDVRPMAALADFYLADEKNFDKAFIYAQKATLMASDSPSAYLLLARVEKRQKKYEEAVISIGKALKMAGEWPEAWYALGSTYEEAGDKEKAEKAYRTLAEKQPQNPRALMTLATFLVDQGKKTDAAEVIAKIRVLNPPKDILDALQALDVKMK